MGWWHANDEDEDLVIGDGPLDAAEDFLLAISSSYENELKRKPTLAEVIAILETILTRRADDIFAEANAITVSSLVARTKKRPKKRKLMPGDVFSFHFPDGAHGFAHLTPQNGVIEVFLVKSQRPVILSTIKEVERVRYPSLVNLDLLEEGGWSYLGNISYDETFEPQHFLIGDKVTCGDEKEEGFIFVSSATRLATDSELESLPRLAISPASFFIAWAEKVLSSSHYDERS